LSPVAGVLTQTRRAGGETFVGGGYLDATREIGRFLLTANGRADAWETFDAHELQGPIGGATTLDLRPSARGGITPVAAWARVGISRTQTGCGPMSIRLSRPDLE
jgi:hypothetical protein